jgi:hypothetical protein
MVLRGRSGRRPNPAEDRDEKHCRDGERFHRRSDATYKTDQSVLLIFFNVAQGGSCPFA